MNEKDAEAFMGECAANSAPYLLLSGGEPLDCPDFFSYMEKARTLGLRVAVSTNGTLVDEDAAAFLARRADYVGVSIDGTRDIHDEFRGREGAFDSAVSAINLLASEGCRVGARVTLTRRVAERLDEVFALLEGLPVSRVCFYRFIRSGRGALDTSPAPDPFAEDAAARRIIEWADRLRVSRGPERPLEILTVGDASDSVRLYEYLDLEAGARFPGASELMRRSAGRASGSGILSVRWDGAVFRNQFLWGERIGGWYDMAEAAGAADRRDMADECLSCGWRARKICGGRLAGFGEVCFFGGRNARA
jgi:MoaA/NifB/PqqE/SkfB family radical SAM enzyme